VSRRIALTIITNDYDHHRLAQLKTPRVDIAALAATLRDPEIGNFELAEPLVNRPACEIRDHIGDLLHGKRRNDVLLIYVAGLLIEAEDGRLYLATTDTRPAALAETAVPADFICQRLDLGFSRQQLLLLDCYHCRLAAQGAEAKPAASIDLGPTFAGTGLGRLVMSAGDGVHYVLADRIFGQVEDSLFTHYFIRGIQTGAADTDRDGQIDARELFKYIDDHVGQHPAKQKPRKWSYEVKDRCIIARNPNKTERRHPLKWDLIFGAIMAPAATIVIGGQADIRTSIGMAGMLMLLYAFLYWALD
jgi:hypothetical protein